MTWWTGGGSSALFRLYFPPQPAPAGRDVGPIRSADIALSPAEVDAAYCAWSVGDRSCSRTDAMAEVHEPIEHAFDELRASAAAAGANVAGNVRCYAQRDPGHLWCEAIARVAPESPYDEIDPAAPIAHEPPIAVTRFALVADGSIAMQGKTPVVGASAGIRYRPIELAFDMLDLSRDGTDRNLFGVGLTALARIGLTRSTEAIAGASGAAVAPNGATNPHFESWWCAFGGISLQSSWRFRGIAVPWVQLRAGAVRTEGRTLPLVALHIGLATPDR